MANELFLSTNLDTDALNLSLADFRRTLVDNAYNDVPVLRLLDQAGRKRMVNGGTSAIEHLIKEKQDDGGWYQGSDTLNTSQSNNITQCEYRWQNCYEPIQITRDDERINAGNDHKLIDFVATRMDLAERGVKDRMGQALVQSVAAAANLNSLADIVGTGTLGTVAGATETWWQSTVTTSGAFAAQGLTDMTTLYYNVSSSSVRDNPTHIIGTETIFRKFEQTRLPLERISNTATANAGFENLTFKGKPFIYDQYVDSGVLYMLNMNYLSLQVDSETDFITTEFMQPYNQTVKVAFILWRGALTTNNRRRHGKLTSVS